MRILFKKNNIYYKYIRILPNKKKDDNSFYFHFYENKNSPVRAVKINKLNDNLYSIKNEFEEIDFLRHHISFHESGEIHSKSYSGQRKFQKSGKPFYEIESTFQIMLSIPKALEQLQIEKNPGKEDVVFDFNDNNEPFSIHFEIVNLHNRIPNPYQNPNMVLDYKIYIQRSKKFGLGFYIQNIPGDKMFPIHSVIVLKLPN